MVAITRRHTGLVGACLLALVAQPAAQDRLAHLQAQFERESDLVHKAKTLSKLQEAEFDAARREANAGRIEQALRLVEQYRDALRSVHAALVGTGINAEKKPAGFKQLEISVRESIRELNDISLALSLDQRSPFDAVRSELEEIQGQLLKELFPRQPGKKKSKQ